MWKADRRKRHRKSSTETEKKFIYRFSAAHGVTEA